jgi:hypothetical protein
VMVSPARLRAVVAALGAVLAIAVGFSLLVLAWHMPSDVFGGYLVGALWVALALAALAASERQPHVRRAESDIQLVLTSEHWTAALLALVALTSTLAPLLLARLGRADYLVDHPSLAFAAGGITILVAVICGSFTAGLRR